MLKSPQTGYIHHNYSCPSDPHTIPIVENFCHVLELFQTKTAENLYEGRFLLERLLHFQAPCGNFPQYLHEYPYCHDQINAFACLAPLRRLQKEFHSIITSIPLQKHLNALYAYCHKTSCARSHHKVLLKAALNEPICPSAWKADTAAAWADLLIASTLIDEPIPLEDLAEQWSGEYFIGLKERQEKAKQQSTLLNLFLKQSLPDHPIHLKKALVKPITLPQVKPRMLVYHPEHRATFARPDFHLFRLGELVCQTSQHNVKIKGTTLTFFYEKRFPEKPEKQMELRFYYPHHPKVLKASTFQLGEIIRMGPYAMKFELIEGRGRFYGHIGRGNRPAQLKKTYPYDWEIGLRTLSRSDSSTIRVSILPAHEEVVGSAEGASPIACMP